MTHPISTSSNPTAASSNPEKTVVNVSASRGIVHPLPELRKSGKAIDGIAIGTSGVGVGSHGDKNGNINGLCVLESFKRPDSPQSLDGSNRGEIKTDWGKTDHDHPSVLTALALESSEKSGHGKLDLVVEISQSESIPIQQPSETKTGIITEHTLSILYHLIQSINQYNTSCSVYISWYSV